MALAQIARKVVKQRHLYQVIEDEINTELSKYASVDRCARAHVAHTGVKCSPALNEKHSLRRRRRQKAVLIALPDYSQTTVVFTMLQRQARSGLGRACNE
jgi:hypothetical protein